MMEKRIMEKMVKAMEIEECDKILLNFWGEDDNLEELQQFEEVLTKAGIEFQTLFHQSKNYAELFRGGNAPEEECISNLMN